jgi:hypothetical protein
MTPALKKEVRKPMGLRHLQGLEPCSYRGLNVIKSSGKS